MKYQILKIINPKFKSSSAKARSPKDEDRMALYILNFSLKGKGILRENR